MNRIGANGEGFTARYNQQDVDMLSILAKDKEFVMRFPGGSDAKNAYLSPNVVGLGMNAVAINAFYDLYGKDENSQGRESDLKKIQQDQMEDQSYLIDIVQLVQQIPKLKIVYCLNVFADPSVNINAIQYLIDNNVDVIGIVAGNELYFTLSFDFAKYITLFEQHNIACKNIFPTIPFALCFGQDVNRSTHRKWNEALIAYVDAHPSMIDAVDTHPYMGADDLQEALLLHPACVDVNSEIQPIAYSPNYNAALDAAFNKYNEIWGGTTYYNDCFSYIETNIPQCKIWCSEFGCIPVEYWGNTLSNGAYYFSVFIKHMHRIENFMMQNLQGSFFWAAMFNHVPHVQYYVLQLIQQMGANISDLNSIAPNTTLQIEGAGEFYFPFTNLGDEFYGSIVADYANTVVASEKVYVDAPFNYSTEGAAGFYIAKIGKETQVIPNDVGGVLSIACVAEHFLVGKNQFGYIKVTTEKRKVYGCTDPKASNYNSAATEDDGSCVYPAPVVKGCTDPKASNYNSKATEDDGSCVYPSPVVKGCTDPKAKNYNSKATEDDGSCVYKKRKYWWNPFSWFSILIIALIFSSCTKELFPVANNVTVESSCDVQQNDLSFADTIFITGSGSRSMLIACDSLLPDLAYPDQNSDDYLHPERFWNDTVHLIHVAIVDHIITRKEQNIFIPNYNDSIALLNDAIIASGSIDTFSYIDFCDVDFVIKNPSTGQVFVYLDVFNWVDDEGRTIFNLNRELEDAFDVAVPSITFTTFQFRHRSTKVNMNFNHSNMVVKFYGLY